MSEKSRIQIQNTNYSTFKDPHSAFQQNDVAASISYHNMPNRPIPSRENHGSANGHLKSIVYGGLDGIITTFATVTSVAGAQLSPAIVLIFGIAHLIADGLSMGMGDALSTQAEIENNLAERAREEWEMENHPEGEMNEMMEIYKAKGIDEKDAKVVLETLAKYKKVFLDLMMVEELGMMPVDPSESPILSGLVTFVSFVLFGFIPLLSYLVNYIPGIYLDASNQFILAVVLTVLTLFVLGAVKGSLVNAPHASKSQWWRNGGVMCLNGSFAAFVGYLVGFLLKNFLNTPV